MTKLADVAKRAVWPALVFNLSNEPAFKFNLCVFGDKSNDVTARTSYFTSKQVIYLETDTDRYEICRKQDPTSPKPVQDPESPAEGNKNSEENLYTLSRVLNPHELDNEFYSLPTTAVPLEPKFKEIIADNLDWQDFLWSDYSLRVVRSTKEGGPVKDEKKTDGEECKA